MKSIYLNLLQGVTEKGGNMTEEKNKLKEKAFEIVKKLKGMNNIFLPQNKKLKSKLIAELESIVPIDTQEKVENTLNRPILFVGDVYKSMLAGCYAHCVRKVVFALNLFQERLEEASIKHCGYIIENFEMTKQTMKDLSEIEGEFIFKDCFGQPIEKLWYGDDPAYCHASVFNPNRNAYTQNTGIKNWLGDYRLGKTLFLVCLEGNDSNECKEFVKNIHDMSYPKPGIPGKLIAHTRDINKLPGYFPEPFEVIELESEKKGTPDKQDVSPIPSVYWSVSDDKQEVCLNGKTVTNLSGIPYKLFRCLLKKRGKFVNTGTLEKCWDNKPNYEDFLVDTMNELETKLKNGLEKLKGINVQGKIIESKKTDKRKITAYKLPI